MSNNYCRGQSIFRLFASALKPSFAHRIDSGNLHMFSDWLSENWITAFLLVYGLWAALPFLAPVFMQMGWTGLANTLYLVYSFFCHQLPERSFFFFG